MKLPSGKEMTADSSRHFSFWKDVRVPLLVIALTVAIFNLTDLDLVIQRALYTTDIGWDIGENTLWKGLYKLGNIPALILTLLGVYALVMSFGASAKIKWRKVGLFLVLSMAIGPGLVVNSLLKDRWGRPRPRDLIEFGGNYQYEAPFNYDPISPGKSFPCGHATMGYYFFGLYLLTRRRKMAIARTAFSFAILYGSMIGFARMAQGGHFASDVIVAGALIYIACASIWHSLRMEQSIWFETRQASERSPRSVLYMWLAISAGILILIGVLLATPYSREKKQTWQDPNQTRNLQVSIYTQEADLIATLGAGNEIHALSSGFGFPGSKVLMTRNAELTGGNPRVSFKQKNKGLFTELKLAVNAVLDTTSTKRVLISNRKGNIKLGIPGLGNITHMYVATYQGDVRLRLPASYNDTLYVSPGMNVKGNHRNVDISETDDQNKQGITVNAPSGILYLE